MSGMHRTGYESARPTRVCAATGRAFDAGERYVATLSETPESEDLVRFDFAGDAWEQGARPPAPHRLIAVWRTTATGHQGGRSGLLGEEELLQLFEGMEAAEEGRAAVFRYLLALLLMRKRVLRIVDQRVGDHGRPVLQLVRRGGPKDIEPEIHEVVDPGMDETAIAAGIEELGAVIGGEAVESGRGGE
jgi:hypothetical protein